jgi:hypothetical protein
LIATMVGIVAIVLLGSVAWSAVGALFSAIGLASSALTAPRTPLPTLALVAAATPSPAVVATATAMPPTPTPKPVAPPTPPEPTPQPTSIPTVAPAVRNPWILQPLPEPGGHVAPGAITLEARARGDAPIATIRLELDGAALPVSVEQRNESTWRGFVTTRVTPGEHSARAVVTDASGRSGSYRWTFSAAP